MTFDVPHETKPPFELRYFAYVKRRKDVDVTYCKSLELSLYRTPPAKLTFLLVSSKTLKFTKMSHELYSSIYISS